MTGTRTTYLKNLYAERKILAIQFFGGRCTACGSTNDLRLGAVDGKSVMSSFTSRIDVFLGIVGRSRLLCPEHKMPKFVSGHWKGDKAGYKAKHMWVAQMRGKATICEDCGSTNKCVWANISGRYLRDLADYKSLCLSCHHYFDKPRWGEAKNHYAPELVGV